MPPSAVISLPHLLRGFIQMSPLWGIIPRTIKPAPTLPRTQMPTPAHLLLCLAQRHYYALTYYYGVNHITKKDVKSPNPQYL